MSDALAKTVPIGAVFRQLAEEIAVADQHLAALEITLLDEHLKQVLSSQQITDMQGLDFVRQTLTCIRNFLAISAENISDTVEFDPHPAVRNLPLKGLSARLANPKADEGFVSVTGNVLLF